MNDNRQAAAFVKSNQVKTFSCPKANKTFAVKKGMLTTRSRKNLSTCTKQDEKAYNPMRSVKDNQSKCPKWIAGNKYCNSKVSKEDWCQSIRKQEDYKSKLKQQK